MNTRTVGRENTIHFTRMNQVNPTRYGYACRMGSCTENNDIGKGYHRPIRLRPGYRIKQPFTPRKNSDCPLGPLPPGLPSIVETRFRPRVFPLNGRRTDGSVRLTLIGGFAGAIFYKMFQDGWSDFDCIRINTCQK